MYKIYCFLISGFKSNMRSLQEDLRIVVAVVVEEVMVEDTDQVIEIEIAVVEVAAAGKYCLSINIWLNYNAWSIKFFKGLRNRPTGFLKSPRCWEHWTKYGVLLLNFNFYCYVNFFVSIIFFLFSYGRPYNTEYRIIVENLSTRASWQVI